MAYMEGVPQYSVQESVFYGRGPTGYAGDCALGFKGFGFDDGLGEPLGDFGQPERRFRGFEDGAFGQATVVATPHRPHRPFSTRSYLRSRI